jgi:1,4-dihydroxy-6-naphthoate synthase
VAKITLGYSTCPNDTFVFYAMIHGQVDTEGYAFEPVLEDVETLNQWALAGKLAMTKASFGVLGAVRSQYWCLRSGGALGRGCGPLVVAREPQTLGELARKPIAVPGLHTTANSLLDLRLGRAAERVPMVFHEIMPAVARGDLDAGVIIHEGRFTYQEHGLVAIEDLGQWWEDETGFPIPLGGILLRRNMAGVDPIAIQRVMRRSVEFATAHPDEPMGYVRRHAQEMDEEVMRKHIDLYVNEYSVDVGEGGRRAVEVLLDQGRRAGIAAAGVESLFPTEEVS